MKLCLTYVNECEVLYLNCELFDKILAIQGCIFIFILYIFFNLYLLTYISSVIRFKKLLYL